MGRGGVAGNRVKSESTVQTDMDKLLYNRNMTITVKHNGGTLSIFRLLDYLIIIHRVNKPGEGGRGVRLSPRTTSTTQQ